MSVPALAVSSTFAAASPFALEPEVPLDDLLDGWRDGGHARTVARLRRELATHSPEWAEAIDEHALLDPLLVACVRQRRPAISLAQCVWGLLPPWKRAAELPVRAFEDGRVLLPGLGLFEELEPGGDATLHVAQGVPRLREHPQACLRPLPEVEGLPLYPHRHPFLRPLLDAPPRGAFGRPTACYERTRVSEPTRHNVVALAESLRLLAATSPRQHAELLRDVRLAVVLEHQALDSAAPRPFHGGALLAVRGHESPLYFVEELVAQGSRVMFHELTADWPAFLAVPYATPMRALGGEHDDPRGLGDAVEDVFALVRTLLALEPLLDHPPLRGHLRHELLGRIALALRRLGQGLAQVEHPGLYTEQGLALHRALRRTRARLHGRLGGLLRALDVSDQPRAFEYERFLERNPR
jgi:hypothetical protein